ncbi:hypothetical protein GALMADRAFT_634341 [Galerina marginata CBS 339.88]|uniref:Pentatricopeptide repeat domain-containing protein n=1 Tax=Galerina marginata (strain CBS 339.88) TaxID=685588 RepID=A0A067TLW2_GALM3|nr:hypothetical protein GALMADRAFT_634341 [Galerina marginata CBS 339.88]
MQGRCVRAAFNSSRCSSSIALPSDSISHAQRSGFQDLTNALSTNASPAFVWANYTNLLTALGNEPMPVELHQQVLRRCTPPRSQLRRTLNRQLAAGRFRFTPPVFESRFQTLMGNIRSLGLRPTLDDYNYVLERFASVGYYEGSSQVYEELKRVGHIPDHKTFGFCFQAIAHRLTLPVPKDLREEAVGGMQSVFKSYMVDMRHYRIPMTTVNLDLTLRILKETLDFEGLEAIMRWGYGIDLSNPDRVALEYADPSTTSEDAATPVAPFPFTTTALNTTIDMLGHLGNVSKLVQAFEVLTQPLPQANQHFFNSFESDEDDDFGIPVDVASSSKISPPSAIPNTTTYTLLLRHLCTQGHAIFARHYINQARRLDRALSWSLKHMVKHRFFKDKPFDDVPTPRFAINRHMLLSVMGESNRDKNLGLMKWLSTQLPYLISKQEADLAFYLPIYRELHKRQPFVSPPPVRKTPSPPVLELDIENPPPPKLSTFRAFQIDVHIKVLKRNISELEEFRQELEFVLGRTHQRVKERLGRRVWQSKDVFLLTEQERLVLTREHWRDIVNFKLRKETHEDLPRFRSRLPNSRKMSTFAPLLAGSRTPIPPIPVLQHQFSQP